MEAGHELRPSSSRQSSSSHSQGSAAVAVGAGASKKENPESGAPDVSSERAPRAFLNTSFGQRLSAQCGAIFLDAHNKSPGPEAAGFSRPQAANGILDKENTTSTSGARASSSGVPEADASGMAPVATEPRPVRLWAFPPAARALALSAPGPGSQVVKRDTSPLVHRLTWARSDAVTRAEHNGRLRVLEIEQGKKQNGTLSSDLDVEDRKDVASAARTSNSLSLEQGAKLQSRQQQQHAEEGQAALLTTDTSLPGPSLSVAADSEGPSETGAGPKRPSFKSDCGFLKLLPSKRKFSPEDHEAHQPKTNASYVLSGDRHMACPSVERLSSNGSASQGQGNVISRRSLLLHLKSTSANDFGGMKEFNQGKLVQHNRDWSTGKERKTAACPDGNATKPVVGSFMKWMIDVGKGLAKKRCFGTMHPPPADMSPTSSPITGICADPSRSKASSNLNLASRMCDSSKPSEDERTGLSPQSCQNMDTEEPTSQNRREQQQQQLLLDSSPKQATEEGKNSSVPEEACDMHTSGDEHQQQQQQEQPVQTEASHAADVFRHAAELHSSQNATQGTTSRSLAAGSQLKDATVSNKQEQQQQQQQQEPEEVVSAIKNKRIFTVGDGDEPSLNVWTSSSALAEQTKVPKRGIVEVRTPGFGTMLRSPRIPVAGEMVNECSQGMAEFVASMACVKNWVIQNGVKTSPVKSRNNKRCCNFCGLDGHTVVDCSETLDCELKDLERRACLLDEMGTELRDLPCLRCLGMGHLGAQCRFSVTEAASRARENSELRSWNFARKSTSASAQHQQHLHQQQKQQQQQDKTVVVSNGLKQRTSPSEKHNNTNVLKTKKQDGTSPVPGNNNLYKKLSFPASKDTKVTNVASKRKPAATDSAPPALPKNMLALVEAVRLSRSELWRWVDFPDVSTQVRGFFLRLRFGRWEKDLGGTGYRMARIRGALRKTGTEEKNMSVSVDLGDLECTVDSQYVSNHPFTEAELLEWWRGRWKAGKRVISEAELQVKLAQRKSLLQ